MGRGCDSVPCSAPHPSRRTAEPRAWPMSRPRHGGSSPLGPSRLCQGQSEGERVPLTTAVPGPQAPSSSTPTASLGPQP